MEGDRKDCLIKISLALKLQHSLMRELLLYIKDPVLIADPGTLARLPIERAVVESINRVGEGEVDSVRQRMEQDGIGIISIIDEDYPPLLKNITDPPGILFIRGKRTIVTRPSVCVVGSRLPTPEGMTIAHHISGELAREGIVVISGLARGIDRAVHRGALDAGGHTVAVLGNGPDIVYPRECGREYHELTRDGAVLSELHPGTNPRRMFFPRRNRIMSGMSLGVVVVEAARRSGALITAHHALEEGREVFAVPGSPLNPTSRGTNDLIKQGAFPVEGGRDITEALELSGWLRPRPTVTSETHDVLKLLGGGPRSIEELSVMTGRSSQHVLVKLVDLEVGGFIEKLPGMRYRLR